MANCIAECFGYDNNREKYDHRLGSEAARAVAATWQTEAIACISKDGSGCVEVRSKGSGKVYHRFTFGPESERE